MTTCDNRVFCHDRRRMRCWLLLGFEFLEDDGLGLDGRRDLQLALPPLLLPRPLQRHLLLPRGEPLARRPLEVHPHAPRGRRRPLRRLELGPPAEIVN